MKTKILSLLSVMVLAIPLFAACGAGGADTAASENIRSQSVFGMTEEWDYAMSGAMPEPAEAPAMEPMPEAEFYAMTDDVIVYDIAAGSDMGGGMPAPVQVNYAEKIIYSYSAYIETLDFDGTLEAIDKLMAEHGAFIESSNIDGTNYESFARGWSRYRSANFRIRVPVEQLTTVTGKLDSLGHVVNQSSYAENITSQFTDTESRLNSLRVQEERLLDMLRRAEDVPDLITIETHLSDVRYQIERLTTTLNQWQHQVDYSTLSLTISEVEAFQEPPPPVNRTYWERMSDGFISTLRSVGLFFTELFMWLVVSAPVLIILAIITVIIVIIVRKQMRKTKQRLEEKRKVMQQQYPPVQQQPAPPEEKKEDK